MVTEGDAWIGQIRAWDVATAAPDAAVADLVRDLPGSGQTLPLTRVLSGLLASGEEMVAATDESGKIIGVASFEDIVAQLAGDIADGR